MLHGTTFFIVLFCFVFSFCFVLVIWYQGYVFIFALFPCFCLLLCFYVLFCFVFTLLLFFVAWCSLVLYFFCRKLFLVCFVFARSNICIVCDLAFSPHFRTTTPFAQRRARSGGFTTSAMKWTRGATGRRGQRGGR